jgi:hypothetical protein
MNFFKKTILTSATFILIVSCNNTNSDEKSENVPQKENQQTNTDEISLNNNEKWAVNEEMKPFILDAEIILNEYLETEASDYQTLTTQLKEKNKGLIQNCSMKGASHDELHKWLHPHMDLIDLLAKSESNEDAQLIVQQLEKSFDTFHLYFE